MKIGILSDTHDDKTFICAAAVALQKEQVDLVFHAGDVTTPDSLRLLSSFPALYVVRGNSDKDPDALRATAQEMGAKYYDDYADLIMEKKAIAVLHSDNTEKFGSLLASQQYDYIIYGNTHQPIHDRYQRTHLINPGAHDTGTVAVLDLESGRVTQLNVSAGKKDKRPKSYR